MNDTITYTLRELLGSVFTELLEGYQHLPSELRQEVGDLASTLEDDEELTEEFFVIAHDTLMLCSEAQGDYHLWNKCGAGYNALAILARRNQ